MTKPLLSFKWQHKSALNSFSLVEVLASMAILSIILVVLTGMASSLMTTWQMWQAKNERRTVAQTVLERMAYDLRQVTLPSSRSTNNLQFVINPSGVTAAYRYPQAIFWQTPVATDGALPTSAGNLAVVGYFVQWINGAPCLSRVIINPSSTNYYDIYTNPSSWMTDAILQTNAPATAASGYVGLLADDVLGLWVQALDSSGNPIQQSSGVAGENFDSRLSYTYTSFAYTGASGGLGLMATNLAPALPARVQIAIVVVDSRTARRLTGSEKPSTTLTGNFWGDVQNFYTNLPPIIQKGAEIRSTTVEITQGPR